MPPKKETVGDCKISCKDVNESLFLESEIFLDTIKHVDVLPPKYVNELHNLKQPGINTWLRVCHLLLVFARLWDHTLNILSNSWNGLSYYKMYTVSCQALIPRVIVTLFNVRVSLWRQRPLFRILTFLTHFLNETSAFKRMTTAFLIEMWGGHLLRNVGTMFYSCVSRSSDRESKSLTTNA